MLRSIASLALLTSVPTVAAAAKPQPLFAQHDVLPAALSAPLQQLSSERKQDQREYLPGTLRYVDAAGRDVELAVEVVSRGNFRRKECRNPPLRLKFKSADVEGTLFANQRRLKLVMPCRWGGRYEQYVIEEYLLYRVFMLLSDYHFMARPVRMEFKDSARKAKSRSSFAFLIEDRRRMAKRYDRYVPDWPEISYQNLDSYQAGLLEVFQFMIGGHDWSAVRGPAGERCCHNSRLIAVPDSADGVIPVPYDFDFSGAINATYAGPPENLPIKSVRQRYFRGRCKSEDGWQRIFDRFRAQKAEIMQLYEDAELLTASRRKTARKYFEQFYAILDDPARTEKMLTGHCWGSA